MKRCPTGSPRVSGWERSDGRSDGGSAPAHSP